MTIDRPTSLGDIKVTLDTVSAIVAEIALECYGVVGLTPRNNNIGDQIMIILDKNKYSKAIALKKLDKGYDLSLFLILAMNTKISEVISEVQKRVRYVLNSVFEKDFFAVNVFVQGLSDGNEVIK
ncbi:MAG: Asp23/Gls24 family envelope stress response protein [Erysipelotrichaceae bacterium]|jgi:uncharacterized alkaline shock family protein YloU|nr:Asp23/Gls24 family envelope stress response protein [Erysipelotrichaceae bacterium]